MIGSGRSGLNNKKPEVRPVAEPPRNPEQPVAFHIVAKQAGNYCVINKHRPGLSFNEGVKASNGVGDFILHWS